MNEANNSIWKKLANANIVKENLEAITHQGSPWYVKTLQAISAWLAALMLMIFFGFNLDFETERWVALILGASLIYAAYLLLLTPNNDFAEHLGLASSLAGQALIIIAIKLEFDVFFATNVQLWLLIGLFELLLAISIPNFIHRFFSAFAAVCAFYIALMEPNLATIYSSAVLLLTTWLWLNEFRFNKYIKVIQGVSYGFTFALIFIYYFSSNIGSFKLEHITDQPWMGELLVAIVMLYLVWQLLKRYQQPITGRIGLAALLSTLLLAILSLEAQGVVFGAIILLLGFANANRILMGLGIICLFLFISTYYYFTQVSLLDKSFSLLLLGLALLLIRWLFVHRFTARQEKTDD